jgi:hypothetical protein
VRCCPPAKYSGNRRALQSTKAGLPLIDVPTAFFHRLRVCAYTCAGAGTERPLWLLSAGLRLLAALFECDGRAAGAALDRCPGAADALLATVLPDATAFSSSSAAAAGTASDRLAAGALAIATAEAEVLRGDGLPLLRLVTGAVESARSVVAFQVTLSTTLHCGDRMCEPWPCRMAFLVCWQSSVVCCNPSLPPPPMGSFMEAIRT